MPAAAAAAAAVEKPVPAVDASCLCCSCSSSAGVAVAAERSAFAAAGPAGLVAVPAAAVGHFEAGFEIVQSPAAEEFAGWPVEAATREAVEVAVVLASVV